jgi:hypothetical protein
MANSKWFHSKLTGAKASLFAHACENYSKAAENACNDTPVDHPIFSWLSPHQRLQLVREVMVGLLCPDEPLPPETIQHYTTFLAVVVFIWIQIGVEIDDFKYAESIGDDLRVFCDAATDDRKMRTPEEMEERMRNMSLIARQAEKNKEKMDRAQAGTDMSLLVEFQASEEAGPNLVDDRRKLSASISALFTGPPVSAETRRLHRPLNEMEQWAFRWRRLVDEALQETTSDLLIWPLCKVDFDWRCPNPEKWLRATKLLMLTHNRADTTWTEKVLMSGSIEEVDYADRSQHARILVIEKIVKDLRDSYDPVWKAELLAIDQRAIFAVCSSEHCQQHRAWEAAFTAACVEQGVDFFVGGDYQKRLEIYRRISPLYKEELSRSYNFGFDSFDDAKSPVDFERDNLIHVTCNAKCDDCWTIPKEALRLCSRCKVVSYCSKECQLKDWPDHKKHCKTLAELRKDKAKVSEIVKNFEDIS